MASDTMKHLIESAQKDLDKNPNDEQARKLLEQVQEKATQIISKN